MTATINASTTAGVVTTADTSGILQLQTNGTAALTVDASQNVGIGTSSGSARLNVNGGTSTSQIRWEVNNAAFTQEVSTNAAASAYVYKSNDASYHVWKLSSAEAMRIDSSGNLLVGTTSQNPGYGNTNTGQQLGGSGVSTFSRGATDFVIVCNQNTADGSTYYQMQFRVSNVSKGSITSTSSATSYNTSSDYRLKNTIAPMTGALDKVALLKPRTYKWNIDGSDGQGFIAHELAEVVPDCVTGEKDGIDSDGNPKYQGIDTSFLVATLTAAIQELKAIVDAQGAEIAALKGATA